MTAGTAGLTPAAAVARGQWMINGAVGLAMWGPAAVAAAAGWIAGYRSEGFAVAGAIFFPSVAVAWLVWSIQVPRWRLWAYERVDDLTELKARAVAAQLIWPEGHWFEKTEIRTQRTRDALRRLEATKR